MDLSPVLTNLYPNGDWYLKGYTYEGLVWNDTEIPKPTLEELTAKQEELIAAQPLKDLRKERDALLIKTDKYALPDWPHETPAKQTEWLDYRQALRDLPNVTDDPANPVWPTVPSP
jgi:hypothetical protein